MTAAPILASPALDAGKAPVDRLLLRMRAGDRAAAGEFMSRYGSRIRRRIRFKLSRPMRRLFDSQEILSTVARRLDLYVGGEHVEASVPEELWALVFRIADNALVDKARLFQRLEAVEGTDGDFAHTLLSRVRQAEKTVNGGVELEMERVFGVLESPLDRQLLSLWLGGNDQFSIAQQMGMSHDNVRRRWSRLRERLRALIEDGSLG